MPEDQKAAAVDFKNVLLSDRTRGTDFPPTTASDRLRRDSQATRTAWKPTPDRRQSWSEQEMRHHSQARRLSLEHGKEPGFSETETETVAHRF